MTTIFAFTSYHFVKIILWRFGYFATFFYKTRFWSFPILAGALTYNANRSVHMFKEADVFEYYKNRARFEKHSELVEKVLKNRYNLLKEKEIEHEQVVKIDSIINETKKV